MTGKQTSSESFVSIKPVKPATFVGWRKHLMTRVFKALLITVVGSLILGAHAQAATRTAASCNVADVQKAINGSRDGDTVLVPAGDCTWSEGVTIDKTVSLKGAGSQAGGTRLIYSGADHSYVTVDVGNKTGFMEISGFFFDKPWLQTMTWQGLIQLSGPVGWKNVRFHHNHIRSYDRDWHIMAQSHIYALIDHNVFEGKAGAILTRGRGDMDWTSPLVLGTADWFFIEDNTFDFTPDGNQYPVNDMQNGGRIVFRNNTVKSGFFQTHDMMRNGYPSGQAYEIYGNTFSTSIQLHKAIELNSGTGVVFNNAITGTWNYGIGLRDYKTAGPKVNNGTVDVKACNGSDPSDQNVPGTNGWRCRYQIGTHGVGASAVTFPLYVWSNTCDGTDGGCSDGYQAAFTDDTIDSAFSNTPTSAHVVSGRDFINNGTMPKAGYTPYAYPHPLQSGRGTSSSNAPSAPAQLGTTLHVSRHLDTLNES